MGTAAIALVPTVVWFFLCWLVGRVAASYRRPPATWFLLALLLSPVAAYVLLLLAGDPEEGVALREKEERIRQLHPELKDVRHAALNETRCPGCGATVNPVTGDGLHWPEAEPWLLICDQCEDRVEPDV